MNELNEQYKKDTSMEHRQAFGQFFTPPIVAEFMCNWILQGKPQEILDPAFGLGAFFKALLSFNQQTPFHAYELDQRIITFYHQHENNVPNHLTLINDDYLTSWGQKYGAIICNPPYMRFQKFLDRKQVFDDFQERLSIRLSGYTNIASAFLIKSLHELRPGGRLAYIMPSEFLNTGYGEMVKSALLTDGTLKAIIKLNTEQQVFPDVITTVAIILACKDGRKEPVCFCSVNDMAELAECLISEGTNHVASEELEARDKWQRYFNVEMPSLNEELSVPLKHYGEFKRGIATGANEFFVLSRSDIKKFGLSESSFLHCLSRSSQVRKRVLDDDDVKRLIEQDLPVFVLNTETTPQNALADYIRQGETLGYHQRYLTRHRNPWYRLEKRPPAPLLMGVFNRGGLKVIRNRSFALNLTCFHGFYPSHAGTKYLDYLFLYLCSQTAERALAGTMRRYGNRLNKFEPGDLNNAYFPSPEFFDLIPHELIGSAMEELQKDNTLPEKLQKHFTSLLINAE